MNIRKFISFSSLLLASVSAMAAPQVSVTATLDSVDALQGTLRVLDVEVIQDASVQGRWTVDDVPIFEIIPGLEVNTKGAVDTVDLGNNRLQLRRTMLIQPFDSGEFIIPGIEFIAGPDTFRSNELAIRVFPAYTDTMTTVHALMPAIEAPRHFFDWVPDWIADYWWAYVIALVVIAGGVLAWWINRKGGVKQMLKSAPAPVPPYEKAISELQTLRSRQLCEKGQEREFYTELTEILRQYLEGRFGINAMEMTTTQIKAAVRANSTTARSSAQMNQILEMADFVKFAKMRPLPEDNVRSYTQAVNFVEDTKPEPVQPTSKP